MPTKHVAGESEVKMMFVITPCNTHAQRSCAIRIDPVGGSYTSKPSAAGKGGKDPHVLCHLEREKASGDIASTGPYGSIAAGPR